MALVHNSVPTTCTASMITGWSVTNINSKDPKVKVNTRLQYVDSLIQQGFKRDFAILQIIITEQQRTTYDLDEFLPLIGFKKVFTGEKKSDDGAQRHKETGTLHMWAAEPRDYEEALKAFKKALLEEKDRIDPPKKPDPARQKFPDLKLTSLIKDGMVFKNAYVDNRVRDIMNVSEEVLIRNIKMKYGFDPKVWSKRGDEWSNVSVRTLKAQHKAWKEELV